MSNDTYIVVIRDNMHNFGKTLTIGVRNKDDSTSVCTKIENGNMLFEPIEPGALMPNPTIEIRDTSLLCAICTSLIAAGYAPDWFEKIEKEAHDAMAIHLEDMRKVAFKSMGIEDA